jgi:Domain of unknown function (DUF4132)
MKTQQKDRRGNWSPALARRTFAAIDPPQETLVSRSDTSTRRAMTAVDQANEPVWMQTESGYGLTLIDNKLVCRNAKGKTLASIPAAVKDDPVAIDLRGLAEWLGGHEKECRERVDAWMLRSLPIPRALISSVWADSAWQSALRDCAIAVVDDNGLDMKRVGLLREATDDGVGVVDLDGNTKRWACDRIAIPHPVLLPDLDDWREFTAELNVQQVVPQLFRETHVRPRLDDVPISVNTFSGGKYAELRHVQGRSSSHGYSVSGGFAVCRVWEDSELVEARLWIGSDSPESETETGDLYWVNSEGEQLKGSAIGPVAWSEGNRMGADLFAGRVIEKEEEAQ